MGRRVIDRPRRGEIWRYQFKRPDKTRPVVVISRDEVLTHIDTAVVASVTSTIRGTHSEVIVGVREGLKRTSAVNLDHLQTVRQSHLRGYVGSLSQEQMRAICDALAVATGCA